VKDKVLAPTVTDIPKAITDIVTQRRMNSIFM